MGYFGSPQTKGAFCLQASSDQGPWLTAAFGIKCLSPTEKGDGEHRSRFWDLSGSCAACLSATCPAKILLTAQTATASYKFQSGFRC